MRKAGVTSPWLSAAVAPPGSAGELVCLPPAGGGGAVFHDWARIARSIQVTAVLLPGRESRLREPAPDDLDVLVDRLLEPVAEVARGRYALFGHSMGAVVAFELARRIRSEGLPDPAGLFVAGVEAPQVLDLERLHDLPRDELIERLGEGIDPEALRYPELIDLMLPTLRADLALAENYRYRPGPPLDVPIHVLHGRDDHYSSIGGARAWEQQTTAGAAVTEFAGGHFFVQEHREHVVRLIEAEMSAAGPNEAEPNLEPVR